jgi:hypothetical protein
MLSVFWQRIYLLFVLADNAVSMWDLDLDLSLDLDLGIVL